MKAICQGYEELSAEIGQPVRTLRTLKQKGLIPYVPAGHRLILFFPDRVLAALQTRDQTNRKREEHRVT